MRAEQFSAPLTYHGEGPYWDDASGTLLMVDMLAGDVLRLDAAGQATRTHVGTVAAALRTRTGGGYVLGLERGFALADAGLRVTAEIPVFDDPAVRMNDGGCDPQGRFYLGSMNYAETPEGGDLYRLDPDGSVTRILEKVWISNGLQWSADGALVYYNDSPTGRVDVFDFDAGAGTFHDRRPFAVIPEGGGFPDGMAIDVEGGIWIALWTAGAVHRYDPDGTLTDVVELPVHLTTACTFGGPDRRTLYVTTSRKDLADPEPQAGAVFVVETPVAGAVPHPFAG